MVRQVDLCAQYVVAVLRAMLQQEPVPDVPEGLSLREVYSFSRRHAVESMVWYGLDSLKLQQEPEIWQDWSERMNVLMAQSITQLSERDSIYKKLLANGIDILPVKGCWMKELYDQIDYRQMSDLDILIHEEDLARARVLMESMGYERTHYGAGHDEAFQKKPYVTVELHYRLIEEGDPHADFCDTIWERARKVPGENGVRDRGTLYRMTPEDTYLYCLIHMEKHFRGSGCGVRYLLDLAVLEKNDPERNEAYVHTQLECLKLSAFAHQAEKLSHWWFAQDTACGEGAGEPAAQVFYDRVVRSGIYGTRELYVEQRIRILMEQGYGRTAAQLRYFLERSFLPLRKMKAAYPVLSVLPILLPFCWIHRLVKALLRKREVVRLELMTAGKRSAIAE